jgi:hypothetical protein
MLTPDDLCLAIAAENMSWSERVCLKLRALSGCPSNGGWQAYRTLRQSAEVAQVRLPVWNDQARIAGLLRIYVLEFAAAGTEPGIYPIIGLGAHERAGRLPSSAASVAP